MALSRLARELAAEIEFHDWSDSPYRVDKAGHRREHDTGPKRSRNVLETDQEARVRTNVAFVVGQVLGHAGLIEPKDIGDWMVACGVNVRVGSKVKAVPAFVHFGFRWTGENGEADEFAPPMPSQRYLDRQLGIAMTKPGPWNDIDLDDETLIDLDPVASYAVNGWCRERGIPETFEPGSLADHLRKNCHVIRENPEEPHTVRWIHLGELRRWFLFRAVKNGHDVLDPELDLIESHLIPKAKAAKAKKDAGALDLEFD